MAELSSESEQKRKRGRPRSENSVHKHMTAVCGSRHKADMIAAVKTLRPDKAEEWIALAKWKAKRGEVSMTMLGYLARLNDEDQLRLFPYFKLLGARYAKRYVECCTRPPTREKLVERITSILDHEFPVVDPGLLASALREIANDVETPL